MKRRYITILIGIFVALCAGYGWYVRDIGRAKAEYRVPILVYHNVRDATEGSERELYVTPEVFESHLKYLMKNGYTAISFGELIDAFEYGATLPDHPVIISFDDAGWGQYRYAAPLLKKYELSATFFLWTEMIGMRGFLSDAEVRALIAAGMEIGGHGMRHRDLTTLTSDAALYEEVFADKVAIEARFGVHARVFAYPYGVYDDRVIAAVKAAGYEAARTIAPDVLQRSTERYLLRAHVMERNASDLRSVLGE